MNEIIIYHAYKGFLYAPLFLANELGFLPECVRLEPAKNDLDAINKVRAGQEEEGWFAICDPFAVDAYTLTSAVRGERLRIIATIIQQPVFWAYTENAYLNVCSEEKDLVEYFSGKEPRLSQIACYQKKTTGHVFGLQLSKLVKKRTGSSPSLVEIDLDNEHSSRSKALNDSTLLLTSDILFLAHSNIEEEKDSPKIIYSYTHSTEKSLHPYLFTALVTLQRKVIQNNVAIATAILHGISKAEEIMRRCEDCTINKLTRLFGKALKEMELSKDEDQEKIIREALNILYKEKGDIEIYPKYLVPDLNAAVNARNKWNNNSQNHGHVEKIIDYGPSLLINKDWNKQPKLQTYLFQQFKSWPVLRNIIAEEEIGIKYRCVMFAQVILTIIFFPIVLFTIHHVFEDGTIFEKANLSWILTLIASYILFAVICVLSMRRLFKGEFEYFFDIAGWALAVLITGILSSGASLFY